MSNFSHIAGQIIELRYSKMHCPAVLTIPEHNKKNALHFYNGATLNSLWQAAKKAKINI